MNVYERLQNICRLRGISITSLCLKATGNKGNLSTWKNNDGHMRSDYLSNCADILGCTTDYILGRNSTEDCIFSEVDSAELKPHIIAYIDLLGTKNSFNIESSNASGVLNKYHKLYNAVHKLSLNLNNDEKFPHNKIKLKIFSDNIVFAIEYTEKTLSENASYLIAVVSMFQYEFALQSIPMRGGICCGDLYMDELFVIGEGLVKAYELEKTNAFFQRIIIDPILASLVLDSLDATQETECSIKFDFDSYPFLNYLVYTQSEDDIKSHYDFLNNNINEFSSSKDKQKNNWAKYYHNLYCLEKKYNNYIFKNITVDDSHDYNITLSNSYNNSQNAKIIQDNHGIIGHTHAPVTIINGSERELSEQEIALIDLFEKLDVVNQARLLAYAAELEKEV